MTHFVGLDVSQRMTAICVVDKDGRRMWRGQCASAPEDICVALRSYASADAKIGIEPLGDCLAGRRLNSPRSPRSLGPLSRSSRPAIDSPMLERWWIYSERWRTAGSNSFPRTAAEPRFEDNGVKVYSPNAENRIRFAAEMTERCKIPVIAVLVPGITSH